MAKKCVDCGLKDSCAYSAIRIYGSDKIKSVVFDMSSVESINRSLANSPYGRCVYACDNDVADHQSTIIEFSNGVTATFSLSAFTAKVNRSLKIMCEYGEVRAVEKPYIIETTDFRTDKTERIELDIRERGHGGGDRAFVRDFMDSYANGRPLRSTLLQALPLHVMSLLAERSRASNGESQDVERELERLGIL